MKFPHPYTLEQIAALIDAKFIGDPDFAVTGMNEIHRVESGDIVFVDHHKYYDKALFSLATIILINKEVACPDGKALLVSDDPFRDFNKLTLFFKPFAKATTQISASAKIGEGTIIQPNAFVGNEVTIGKNCVIHANVSIYDGTQIGDNVVIHANTVLGAEAFYYKKRQTGFDRLLSSGNVIIEDGVELGACCTIDRGVSASTVVGAGSVLDNQVHVAHDTIIGKRVLIASQTGIAGCCIIEDDVTLWGQVGIKSDVHIKKGATVYAQSGVGKDIEENQVFFGSPAVEARTKFRELAAIKQMPDIVKKLTRNYE
ncbi:MAG: UDP-3-O-(3-hydroxymyristoyl)glucosamine N-acyltransferase [Leeuwenhoekiella sp.]